MKNSKKNSKKNVKKTKKVAPKDILTNKYLVTVIGNFPSNKLFVEAKRFSKVSPKIREVAKQMGLKVPTIKAIERLNALQYAAYLRKGEMK